jgi:peptidoglycan-associated lipoprotein
MRRRHAFTLVTALLLAALSAGCGSKRPPAVSGSAPPPRPADDAGRSGLGREPVDSGPDLRPLSDEGALGEDLALSDASGEGGPLADIRFDYDQATLSDAARARLEKHALWLQTRRDTKVTIEGHCDERGTVEYNLALSDQRARAARDYLVSLGVAPERLTTVPYGKERPLDTGHDESAWARNRRAHFVVSRR